VREKVVRPNLYYKFDLFLSRNHTDKVSWFLTLSPEARCQLAADWLKEKDELKEKLEELESVSNPHNYGGSAR
jgi:hypothetical protein